MHSELRAHAARRKELNAMRRDVEDRQRPDIDEMRRSMDEKIEVGRSGRLRHACPPRVSVRVGLDRRASNATREGVCVCRARFLANVAQRRDLGADCETEIAGR